MPGDRKLVIVGDSSFSQDYTDRLKELARHDPGWSSPASPSVTCSASSSGTPAVFVQPSLLEGLPITLLEAASYGVPVVASDIAPHLEVLGTVSGPGRRTFPTGDLPALAREP